jgi:antitoxin HigA-1
MSKSSTTIRAIATPNRVTTHPGEVLNEEFLRPLGMSINALAIALRVSGQLQPTLLCGWHASTAPAPSFG